MFDCCLLAIIAMSMCAFVHDPSASLTRLLRIGQINTPARTLTQETHPLPPTPPPSSLSYLKVFVRVRARSFILTHFSCSYPPYATTAQTHKHTQAYMRIYYTEKNIRALRTRTRRACDPSPFIAYIAAAAVAAVAAAAARGYTTFQRHRCRGLVYIHIFTHITAYKQPSTLRIV